MRVTGQLGYRQGIVVLESGYARMFGMPRQSQPPTLNVAEDHGDVPPALAADFFSNLTPAPN